MKQRVLSILVFAVLLVALLCGAVTATAAETSGTYEGMTWSFDAATGTITITGTGDMKTPSREDFGYPWWDLGDSVKKAVFSEGITSISSDVFMVNRISSVTLPSTLKKIDDNAFQGQLLTSVNLPEGLTTIGDSAFKGCSELKNFSLPSTLTELGEGAFWGSGAVESVTIPGSVKKVPVCLFCTSAVKNVVLEEGIEIIEEEAFSGCDQMKSIKLPSTLKTVKSGAFSYCNLDSLTVPASVTTVGYDAFSADVKNLRFEGNAPKVLNGLGGEINAISVGTEFSETEPVIYYNKYASGWSTPQWKGAKALPYDPCEKGHSFGDWSVTEPATCAKEGVETRSCSLCKTPETRPVAKADHEYGDWVETKAPTAEEDGIETATCKNCPETKTRSVSLGGDPVTDDATTDSSVTNSVDDVTDAVTDTDSEPESETISELVSDTTNAHSDALPATTEHSEEEGSSAPIVIAVAATSVVALAGAGFGLWKFKFFKK